jgi:MipA family protein
MAKLTQAWGLKLILLIFISGVSAPIFAETPEPGQAYYELGVGVAYSQLPDYLGSGRDQHYLVPFPYLTYQSAKVTIARNEAVGTLWQHHNWSLNLNFAGALPVNSEDNGLRQGMPDLHWLAEFGPRLDYQIQQSATQQLSLQFPLRKVIATDIQHWQSVGWRFEPRLVWQQQLNSQLRLTSQVAALWSTEQYHQYLYGVNPEYATANRLAYQAKAGFSGWRVSLGLSWRSQNWWLGAFSRYDNIHQASFADSPLVQQHNNVSVGLAFAWIFKQQRITL